MITLSYKTSLGTFEKVPRQLLSAVRRAGSEAVRAMRAESSRQVRARKRFKVAKVNGALPLDFPSSSAPLDRLVWRMRVSGEAMPLGTFPTRQTKRGVMVSVNKGASKLFPGAFIATMRSGHKGVFYRTGKARLPIDEAFSTRVSDVFQNEGLIEAIQTHTQTVFARAIARLLPQELKK